MKPQDAAAGEDRLCLDGCSLHAMTMLCYVYSQGSVPCCCINFLDQNVCVECVARAGGGACVCVWSVWLGLVEVRVCVCSSGRVLAGGVAGAYTAVGAHETDCVLVCRLLVEEQKMGCLGRGAGT